MELNHCYNSVINLVSEASRRFGNKFQIDDSALKNMPKICSIIDDMLEEFQCEYFDASVNDITKTLQLCFECDEIILEDGRSHPFFTLIQMADSFSFSKSEEDCIRVSLNIDRLWVDK